MRFHPGNEIRTCRQTVFYNAPRQSASYLKIRRGGKYDVVHWEISNAQRPKSKQIQNPKTKLEGCGLIIP